MGDVRLVALEVEGAVGVKMKKSNGHFVCFFLLFIKINSPAISACGDLTE